MKYYSTQRPITPGTFPSRVKVREIVNFDTRTYCEEIGREAWGYLDIVGSLLDKEAEDYELVAGGSRARIYYEDEYTDDKGKRWLSINGDTHYSLDKWSKEDARADYLSPESEIKRQLDFYRANGFYD